MKKTNRKIAEMQRQKEALENKINAIREGRNFRNTLSRLIESELDKASVVLAAKDIVEKIGKMAEDLAKIEGDDIMPMMDSLKAAFGPNMAEAFQKAAGEKIRAATEAMTQTKDAISNEVSKLEGVVNGGETNDMAAAAVDTEIDTAAGDMGAAGDLGGDEGGMGADMSTEPSAGDEAPLGGDEEGGEMGSELDDPFADDVPNAAGRIRKESIQYRAIKALRESKDPDAVLRKAFKRFVKEGASPKKAAQKVAETFAIDFADVVEIVREGAAEKNSKKKSLKESDNLGANLTHATEYNGQIGLWLKKAAQAVQEEAHTPQAKTAGLNIISTVAAFCDSPNRWTGDAEQILTRMASQAGLDNIHAMGSTAVRLLIECIDTLGYWAKRAARQQQLQQATESAKPKAKGKRLGK